MLQIEKHGLVLVQVWKMVLEKYGVRESSLRDWEERRRVEGEMPQGLEMQHVSGPPPFIPVFDQSPLAFLPNDPIGHPSPSIFTSYENLPPPAVMPCPRFGSSLKDILDLILINFGQVVPLDIPQGSHNTATGIVSRPSSHRQNHTSPCVSI